MTKTEAVAREKICPNCKKTIPVTFDAVDQNIGGKPVICPHCNACLYCYLNNNETVFHTKALGQDGQPRVLRTPAPP
jgi:hypothetical protein